MTNVHNTDALLLGTCEFTLSEGATSLATAELIGYRDFGNMVGFSTQPTNTKVEHKGAYRGTKRIDKTRITEVKTLYQLKMDEWTLQNMLYVYYGSKGAIFTQAAVLVAEVDSIDFGDGTTAPKAVVGYWYDITKSGVRIRSILTFTWGAMVEGTDYELDKDLGRIRFLLASTAPVAPFTPTTLTASVIVAGDPLSMQAITPLTTTLRRGIGRLIVFDDKATNQKVLEHDGFGCDVSLSGNVEGGGDTWSEFTLEVLVTNPVGTVWVREQSGGMVPVAP